jgi:hypothetical protein
MFFPRFTFLTTDDAGSAESNGPAANGGYESLSSTDTSGNAARCECQSLGTVLVITFQKRDRDMRDSSEWSTTITADLEIRGERERDLVGLSGRKSTQSSDH